MKFRTIGKYATIGAVLATAVAAHGRGATLNKKSDESYMPDGKYFCVQKSGEKGPGYVLIDKIREYRQEKGLEADIKKNRIMLADLVKIHNKKKAEEKTMNDKKKCMEAVIEGDRLKSAIYDCECRDDSLYGQSKTYNKTEASNELAKEAAAATKAAAKINVEQKQVVPAEKIADLNKDLDSRVKESEKAAKKPVHGVQSLSAGQLKDSKYTNLRNFYSEVIVKERKMTENALVGYDPMDGRGWLQEGNRFEKIRLSNKDRKQLNAYLKEMQ